MSKFDGLKYYQSATAEEKLRIIGHELLREILIVNGYAAVLKQSINETKLDVPDEWENWINQISIASDDMKEILDIMISGRGLT